MSSNWTNRKFSGGYLLHRRTVAPQGSSTHVAGFFRRKRARAMHSAPVIPHNEVAYPPGMTIDVFALCRVLRQVA